MIINLKKAVKMLESIGVLSLVAISVYLWMNHIESNERFEKDKRNFIRDSWTVGNFAQKYNNSLKEGKPIMSERSANTMIKKLMRDPEVIAEVKKRVEQKQQAEEKYNNEQKKDKMVSKKYRSYNFEMTEKELEISLNGNIQSELIEGIKNKQGYAGDTARILTETYYNSFYNQDDIMQSAYDLITFRTSFYTNFPQVNNVSEEFINFARDNYFDNLPCILFIFFYLENAYDKEQKEFIEENINLIYSIIKEEYISKAKTLQVKPIVEPMNENSSSILVALLVDQVQN